MRKVLIVLLLLGIILGISILRTGRGAPEELFSRREILMGTLVEIKVGGLERRRAENAVAAAFREMGRIDSLASRTKRGDVFRLNRDGEADVSPEVSELLTRSILYGDMTEGGFDITVQPLLERWSYFEDDHISVPSQEELRGLLHLVDYRKVKVEGRRAVLLTKGMGIDLGGIAKGYAVDRAVEVLRSNGVTSALVEAGGDIRLLGTKPDGSPWRVGLRHPRKSGMLTVFELSNVSICTSGDYERFFERGGERYHHIVDPKVGYPARRCCSATVIASDATTADALVTGVFVLGPLRGMALIDSLRDVEGVMVSERNGELEIYVSKGLEGKLSLNP